MIMNFKKILFSALLFGCMSASAQEAETKEDFNPHWYAQIQAGAQYTLGEYKFSKLLSGNAQIAGGYRFTPVWGARVAVGAWQSRAGYDFNFKEPVTQKVYTLRDYWAWNYVAPTVDVTCDLTNLIGGYKYNRLVSVGVLAGIGANIAWNNGDAAAAKEGVNAWYKSFDPSFDKANGLTLLWNNEKGGGTKCFLVGQLGAYVDFRCSDHVSVGIEANANVVADSYNSKDADNGDWYFNGLVGVKYNFGKTHKTVPVQKCDPKVVEKIVEKIVEKPVEKIVYKESEAKREAIRRDIFFTISVSEVSAAEMSKVEDIANYLKKYPQAKVTVTGYADKGTGSAKTNDNVAKKRAQTVAAVLTKNYGISAGRIVVDSKGDTVQPFEENDKNRVSICIAE